MGVIVILKLCNILYVLEIRHLFHGFKLNRSFDESLFGGIGVSREMFGGKTARLEISEKAWSWDFIISN